MSPTPYIVWWRDAFFEFDHDEENERNEYIVQTVGFVVKDGPEFLSLAQEILPDGDGYRAVTHIPHGMVLNRKPLFEGEGVLYPRFDGGSLL